MLGVIPAEAGIQAEGHQHHPVWGEGTAWIPASAGMTPWVMRVRSPSRARETKPAPPLQPTFACRALVGRAQVL